jgi:dCTP deaminase
MPRNLKGQCVGKSTYARCGIIVNTTPLEPGWEGHLTIEIANTSPCEVWLYAGEGIAQLGFELLLSEPEVDYAQKKGKYNKQGPEPTTARTKT